MKIKIELDLSKCMECSTYTCVDCCAMAVLRLEDGKPVVADLDSCTLCGICEDLCPEKAITIIK